jgi:hypothetical protein
LAVFLTDVGGQEDGIPKMELMIFSETGNIPGCKPVAVGSQF